MFVVEEVGIQGAEFPALVAIANDPDFAIVPAGIFPIGFVPALNSDIAIAQYAGTVSGSTASFLVNTSTQTVLEIINDGRTYRLAADSNHPQPGEFTFNPDTRQVVVYGTTFPLNPQFQVLSPDAAAIATNPIYTTTAQLPDIFSRYELTGRVEWSCTLEGQPAANFSLICSWQDAEALKAELQPGKRKILTLYGIGFTVTGINITKRSLLKSPTPTAVVSVTLSGQWEPYLDQEVILDSLQEATSTGVRTIRGDTNVQAIAIAVGARAVIPSNTIYAPKEANSERTISLEEVFRGNLRHNGLFADYCDPTALTGRLWDAVPTHNVMLDHLTSESLEIDVQGFPRAIDYENAPLEWGNSLGIEAAKGEDTDLDRENAPPQWRLKPAKIEYYTIGSTTLDRPVDAVDLKSVLSLNFDNGGITREQKTITTKAGQPISQTTVKWGFAGTSHQHVYAYDAVSNTWSANSTASLPWVQIEDTQTTYTYDADGYLTSVITTGTRLSRLRTESQNEGCQAYAAWYRESDSTRKAKKLQLLKTYEFQAIPVREVITYNTRPLRSHYNDIPEAPKEDYTFEVPKFLPDGSLNRVFATEARVEEFTKNGQPWLRVFAKVTAPGWVDPRYCNLELGVKTAYLSAPNPDSTDKKPLPDFTTGENKEIERSVYVPDYRSRPRPVESSTPGTVIDTLFEEAETYIESDKLVNQLDSSFARSAKDNTQTQNKGRPSEHTRLVEQYEKIDPNKETDPRDTPDPNQENFRYRITTRLPSDPLYRGDPRIEDDTLSFPYAASLEQALFAAQTEMAIANASGTETTTIAVIPQIGLGIREGDRINLEGHGIWRVLGYSKALIIKAPGIVQPDNVQLDLGKEISNPTINLERLPVEKTQGEPVAQERSNIQEPSQLVKGRSLGNPLGV